MNQRTRILTLTFFTAAFIAICVMTCRSFLAVPSYDIRKENIQCNIWVRRQQLFIDLAHSGQITEVQLRRDGVRIATYPGCGTSECNYSLSQLPSGHYQVTVVSTTASFDGDIDWHSPLEATP